MRISDWSSDVCSSDLVGIATAGAVQSGHPLLDETHYLTRALSPYTDLRLAPLSELLDGRFAVIAVTDSIPIEAGERPRLAAWVEAGGVDRKSHRLNSSH